MKVLAITNLFPNRMEPGRATFKVQQLGELSRLCELKIVAPIPLFKYSYSQVPEKEIINGIEVYHPRYPVIPKVLRCLYGILFFLWVFRTVKRIGKDFRFEAILSLWVYPDGFGSFLISKILRRPIVIGAGGSDINFHTRAFLRRKMIAWALKNSTRVIAVSKALRDRMVKIGVPEKKIQVLLNGVNIDLFKPMSREIARKKSGLPMDKRIVLFIGNLVRVKGVDLLIDAMRYFDDDIHLAIVGRGNLEDSLKSTVKKLKLDKKVSFCGVKPYRDMPIWLNSCDVFCLPSRNEGCPNVVMEALSCGVPVVTAKVGGIPELIKSENLGIMVSPENSFWLASGIKTAFNRKWNSEGLRNCMLEKSWKHNAEELFRVLNG